MPWISSDQVRNINFNGLISNVSAYLIDVPESTW